MAHIIFSNRITMNNFSTTGLIRIFMLYAPNFEVAVMVWLPYLCIAQRTLTKLYHAFTVIFVMVYQLGELFFNPQNILTHVHDFRFICTLEVKEYCVLDFRESKILTVYSVHILKLCSYAYKSRSRFEQLNLGSDTRRNDPSVPPRHQTTTYRKSVFYNCRFYNPSPQEIMTAPFLKVD